MFDWDEVLTLAGGDLFSLIIDQSEEILTKSELVDLELLDDR